MPAALSTPVYTPVYTTQWGQAYVGDSLDLLPCLPTDYVNALKLVSQVIFTRSSGFVLELIQNAEDAGLGLGHDALRSDSA
jgi:hypothetical protein